jgi:hypothetical protein
VMNAPARQPRGAGIAAMQSIEVAVDGLEPCAKGGGARSRRGAHQGGAPPRTAAVGPWPACGWAHALGVTRVRADRSGPGADAGRCGQMRGNAG